MAEATLGNVINMQASSNRRGYLWFLFSLSALVCIAWFFIPAFIIRPFTHQTPRGLTLAMALRQRAPWGNPRRRSRLSGICVRSLGNGEQVAEISSCLGHGSGHFLGCDGAPQLF